MTDRKDYPLASFAAQLTLVDEPAALAIARKFKGVRLGGQGQVTMGLRLMEKDPADGAWFWKEMRSIPSGTFESFFWKMASDDPARARRIMEAVQFAGPNPHVFIYLALAEKNRDKTASRQALDEGLRRIDRLMLERPELRQRIAGTFLPVVQAIDPAMVPEVFWRDVASRPPFANPRTINDYSPNSLIHRLAWYDREVAAALFEPSRARMEHTEDRELATWENEFVAWSFFDPRAAVAWLQRVPVVNEPGARANAARIRVATMLGLTYEQRVQRIWPDWDDMFGSGL